jgi:hypothetical protein
MVKLDGESPDASVDDEAKLEGKHPSGDAFGSEERSVS